MQLTIEERELLGKLLRGCVANKSMPRLVHAAAERILAKLDDEFEEPIADAAPEE
jgi:uncharacterized protein (UPF0147 family)